MAIQKERVTNETQIKLSLDRGLAPSQINTGVGFLDHMLDLFAFHGQLILNIEANGDTQIDDHHTTEDIGILLGQAIAELNQNKSSIQRYGSAYVPMDETLARAVVDVSGRPYLVFEAEFDAAKVGSFDTELVHEFFYALVINARLTVHLDLIRGFNTHHEIEALFKAFGQALHMAMSPSQIDRLPSTKGVIES